MPSDKKPPGTPAKPLGVGFALIGSELAGATLIGVAVDYLAGTRGLFAIGFTLVGMVGAVLLTVRLLKEEKGPGGGK